MEKLIIGFIACGGLASLTYFIISWRSKKSDIKEAIHDVTQKFKQKEIKKVEEKQTVLAIEIEKNEKLDKKTRDRITQIKDNATKKIKNTLAKDENVVDALMDINKELEDF